MRKFFLSVLLIVLSGCSGTTSVSVSGVKAAKPEVQTNEHGRTAEQENILARQREDNRPGAVKHLYVVSAYTGQVILYSTVKGKVTSSGKRLSPTMVTRRGSLGEENGLPVDIGGVTYLTQEVLQDDGTYGSSEPYLYWIDQNGVFRQHYVSGGQIIHVSSEPTVFKSLTHKVEARGQ